MKHYLQALAALASLAGTAAAQEGAYPAALKRWVQCVTASAPPPASPAVIEAAFAACATEEQRVRSLVAWAMDDRLLADALVAKRRMELKQRLMQPRPITPQPK